MINDMINVMRNDMIWYEEDASEVVLNDNENGKVLGPHAFLFAHASGVLVKEWVIEWLMRRLYYEEQECSIYIPIIQKYI